MAAQLQTHLHSSSQKGLSSVATLIVGFKGAVLIDPPLLVLVANLVVEFVKSKTSKPLQAVFVTHHVKPHCFIYKTEEADSLKQTAPRLLL
jgi:hypothetical protein